MNTEPLAVPSIIDRLPTAARSPLRRPVSATHPHVARKGHVLLVDDEQTVLRVYGRILRDAGFGVVELSDGHLVCDMLEACDVDVVVTDVAMPSINGVELLQAVRQRRPDLPVVLMSGTATLATALQAVEHGALRYLMKPVDIASLRQTVEDAVSVRRRALVTRRAVEQYRDTSEQESSRADLTGRFERALATVRMVYQPIVRWSDRTVFAYEALVRTGEKTLCRPNDLYSAAAALDRIHDVGRATRHAVSEMVRSPGTPPIFVNLHPRDLDDDELFSKTAPLLETAERIVFEVTECASLGPTHDLAARLRPLRDVGHRFALDDLGAGYAGLTSFAQLRPEIVKLDMSLTRGVAQDPTKRKLIESMVTLCNELGVLVIAEGVETPMEHDALVGLGCDLFQGYLFAAPAFPFPNVTWKWLRRGSD
jgi:EAL domain-containing protein (putative c-di-GMP-specific phosphodiesterase class I)